MRRFLVVPSVLIAVGGYVHFCLWRHGYRTIPKIGGAFLFTAIGSALIAVALLAGGSRLVRLGGIALSAGTLVAFAISRTPSGLFNFREVGFQPSPQAAIAFITETGALVMLLASFVWDRLALQAAPRTIRR